MRVSEAEQADFKRMRKDPERNDQSESAAQTFGVNVQFCLKNKSTLPKQKNKNKLDFLCSGMNSITNERMLVSLLSDSGFIV